MFLIIAISLYGGSIFQATIQGELVILRHSLVHDLTGPAVGNQMMLVEVPDETLLTKFAEYTVKQLLFEVECRNSAFG